MLLYKKGINAMSKTTTSVKEWWKFLKALKKIKESMLCQVKKISLLI